MTRAIMAKKFVPRERKHKKLARQQRDAVSDQHDPNALEILPEEQRARNEAKAEMKAALVQENSGKMSSKKKKRLDKYVEGKLKKEESLRLLKKLAEQKVDVGEYRSSKALGGGKERKKREPVVGRREEFHSEDEDEDEEDEEGLRLSKMGNTVPKISQVKERPDEEKGVEAPAKSVGSGDYSGLD